MLNFLMSFQHLYHLIFGDKSVRALDFHIWNQLPDTLEAKWPFQTFKRLLSDWFGPKYKCKVSSYMENTKVLLRTRLNLGFILNYFSISL